MSELYSFIFCIGLGIAARLLFMLMSLIAKRTDLLPVTVLLDALTVIIVGGAFTAYVILSGATLAPYMFAALGAGYLLTYRLTKSKNRETEPRAEKTQKDKKTKKSQKIRREKNNCPNA
ncbi:MAG: hypothetical protein HDT28_08980 [Clostridiales bacterium]|nr:hypothetical protein [Clostridiales bacterium]